MRSPCRWVVLALSTLAGAAFAPRVEAAKKPFIVVFDFQEIYHPEKFGKTNKWGRWVARNMRKKAVRRDKYQILDELTFEEVMSHLELKYDFNDPVSKFAKIGKEAFQADVIVWGKIEQIGREHFTMRIRGIDLRKSGEKLALDEKYDVPSNKHFRLCVEDALDKLEHAVVERAKRNEDYLADTSWKKRRNLVRNGGFEEGDRWHPPGWDKPDGMCSFIVDGESPTGRCLLLYTDVPCEQYRAWQEKFFKGAPATAAPKPLSTKLPGGRINYGTVGGTVGAHIYSKPIPVKPGMTYRFDVDFRGPKGNTKIFIKGYALIKDPHGFGDQEREIYRYQLNVTARTPGQWEHWCCLLHPTDAWVVYDFSSPFDHGKTGREVSRLLRRLAKSTGLFPVADEKTVERIVRQQQFMVHWDIPPFRIYKFTNEELSAQVAIWGRVDRMGDGYRLAVRALNVRRKQIQPYVDLKRDFVSLEDMSKSMTDIIKRIAQGRPHVKYLKIKPDAYWPSGKYYFDNFTLTEEGAYQYGKKKREY